jgi:hypothetical protein
MEAMIVTRVSNAGGRHLALTVRNCGAGRVDAGILRYIATDRTGHEEYRSTPNGMPVEPGDTVEIFIEIDERISRLNFIDYSTGLGAVPVSGRVDAGFFRWKLRR